MTNTISSATRGVSPSSAPNPTSQMSQADFLKLMTVQMQNQDPFNPMDGKDMLAQMAQISSAAGLAEMNQTLGDIRDQLSAQGAILEDIKSAASA